MKRFVEGVSRDQSTLFPEKRDDFIAEDNPVRVVDVFVEALDLRTLGFQGVDPSATGRPAYHLAVLLKLYVYGYLNCIPSSRRLEREAQRNVELMWLLERRALAALKPLGIEPGMTFDPQGAQTIDGKALAEAARQVHKEALEMWISPEGKAMLDKLFLPKGEMTLEAMVLQSAYGPIGLPAHQAVSPGIASADGQPLNAQHDYVIRMSKDELPPSAAFWSVTLYDAKNGFFIPNEQKKYSVGENAGFQLDEDGGIEIHVATEQPEGVPEENWLPINRGNEALDLVMRIYAPDLEKLKTWTPPKAEKVN